MKILPFGLRSSILPLSLPRVRPEFCVYCYAVVNLRLFPELQSRFFWRYTGHRSRPILALLPFRDGGLKWTRTIDLTLIRRVL